MIGWTSTTWQHIAASTPSSASPSSSAPVPPSDTSPAPPATGPGSTAAQTGRQSPPGWPVTLAAYHGVKAAPKVSLRHPDRYDREPVIYTEGFKKPPVPKFNQEETK